MAAAGVSSARDFGLDHILAGKVTKPHGIKGEIKVFPYSRNPGNFKHYREVWLEIRDDADLRHCNIQRYRVQGDAVILKLDGVETRSAAEELGGAGVWVAKAALPELAHDEYYWHEMMGALVLTDDGRKLGLVDSLFTTKVHDILMVKGGGREYLIPILEGVIQSWDKDTLTLVVMVPPGLLDIND